MLPHRCPGEFIVSLCGDGIVKASTYVLRSRQAIYRQIRFGWDANCISLLPLIDSFSQQQQGLATAFWTHEITLISGFQETANIKIRDYRTERLCRSQSRIFVTKTSLHKI